MGGTGVLYAAMACPVLIQVYAATRSLCRAVCYPLRRVRYCLRATSGTELRRVLYQARRGLCTVRRTVALRRSRLCGPGTEPYAPTLRQYRTFLSGTRYVLCTDVQYATTAYASSIPYPGVTRHRAIPLYALTGTDGVVPGPSRATERGFCWYCVRRCG